MDQHGCNVCSCRGAICLVGPSVEAAASLSLDAVPLMWQTCRHSRDGEVFHITILTKAEVRELEAAGQQDVLSSLRTLLETHHMAWTWFDVGHGTAKDKTGAAAFRVVIWPAAAAARQSLQLPPKDFHITLGFDMHDVHCSPKGISSIKAGQGAAFGGDAAATLLKAATSLRESDAVIAAQLAEAALMHASASSDQHLMAESHSAICLLLGRARQPEKVVMHAEQLLELRPGDAVGARYLGLALLLLGQCDEARPHLEAAIGALATLPEEERGAVGSRLDKALRLCNSAPSSQISQDHLYSTDADFEAAFALRELKFPSTPHLRDLGAATREDKHLDEGEVLRFCGGGAHARPITIEEKIDGANLGISLDSQYCARLQGRSKFVNWETDTQFRGLKEWLEEHCAGLCHILERNRHILFGEWCAARHTIEYTGLPSYFLAFDIFDRSTGRFLSRSSFQARLKAGPHPRIAVVPTIAQRIFGSVEEVVALLDSQSQFGDTLLEGVYLRLDEAGPAQGCGDTFLECRCKLVRPEFQQSIEDGGNWRGNGKNKLDLSVAATYCGE